MSSPNDRPVLIIGHNVDPPMPVIQSALTTVGVDHEVVRPVMGEPLPDPTAHAGIICLGGPQSAYDTDGHPYLVEEIAFLAEAHRAATPVLAICLGAQLLSAALGGEPRPGDSGLECGLIDVEAAVPAGADLAGRWYSFHSDTATVPDGAVVLATSDRYLQAWQTGTSLAVQFHPELDEAAYDRILDVETEKLTRFGVDVPTLRQALKLEPPPNGQPLISRWLMSLSTTPDPPVSAT